MVKLSEYVHIYFDMHWLWVERYIRVVSEFPGGRETYFLLIHSSVPLKILMKCFR